jgi:hypothetical protein
MLHDIQEDGFIGHGDELLGHGISERPKPCPHASSEHERLHSLPLLMTPLFIVPPPIVSSPEFSSAWPSSPNLTMSTRKKKGFKVRRMHRLSGLSLVKKREPTQIREEQKATENHERDKMQNMA